MKANYKLVKRVNPASESKEKLWYATPASKGIMSEDQVATTVTRNTTTARSEFKNAFELASEVLPELLLSGISVKLGKLGTLRFSFGSKGVARPEDFNASLIKNAKFIFTPSTALKEAITRATFENVGVVEDGFTYASLQAYKDYQVNKRPGGTTGEDGGTEGGGQSGNPL